MQTVLVVDDEEEIREMIKAYLKCEGINAIECQNGMEAHITRDHSFTWWRDTSDNGGKKGNDHADFS